MLEDQPGPRGRVHLDVDGVQVTISSSAGRRQIAAGHQGRPDATVAAPLPVLLAIAAGNLTLEDTGAAVSGDAAVARELVAGGGARS